MKLSVCIPNYNYERYIETTIRSVLAEDADLEVLVSDNASTDGSVKLIESIGDPRIKVTVNACNVGFAGNLDRAARMATGDFIVMLSSDDVVNPGGLSAYRKLLDALGSRAAGCVVTAACDIIDSKGERTGALPANEELWGGARKDEALSQASGKPVRTMGASDLLRASLSTMKNPMNFLATLYPRKLWEAVGGYGGGRMINPDKWFHYRLLAAADEAIFVDAPLFSYRWHAQNQAAQQSASSALKYLADEYATTLELDGAVLKRAGLSREQLVDAFVEYDIGRHGLATLARGDAQRARRVLDFGRATYPLQTRKNAKARALAVLLRAGPIGASVAKTAYDLRGAQP